MAETHIGTISEADVHDAGNLPPIRIVEADDDGNEVVTKNTYIPTRKYVNRQGHVVPVTLTTGASLRGENNSYAHRKVALLTAKGFIPYGRSPLREEGLEKWLPKAMRDDKPCASGSYGERQACKHIEAIIEHRRKPHEAKEAQANVREKSLQERELELLKNALTDGTLSAKGGKK